MCSDIPRVLVDNCIFVLAVEAVPSSKSVQVEWWSGTWTVPLAGYVGRAERDEWKKFQAGMLRTVASASRQGLIDLLTYSEIDIEGMSGTFGVQPGILDGVSLGEIQPAIERSRFFQVENHCSGDEVSQFCKFLLDFDPERISRIAARIGACAEEISNIRRLGRYKAISRSMSSPGQLRDAFHLWSAECAGVDFFLTIDKKFVNAVTKSGRESLNCVPVMPHQLVEQLGLPPPEPAAIREGQFYDLAEFATLRKKGSD